MTRFAALIMILCLPLSFVMAGSDDLVERKADFNWKMNCQGCHLPNGAGSPLGAPDMRGIVAKFLQVEGGREYLGRVPGVAYAPLKDQDLADLLNWVLKEYDNENLTEDFRPYTASEIGALRRRPLVEDAPIMRNELLKALMAHDPNMEVSEHK